MLVAELGKSIESDRSGALLEFGSVVEAIQFAIEVQLTLRERNEPIPKDQRIVYRIEGTYPFAVLLNLFPASRDTCYA